MPLATPVIKATLPPSSGRVPDATWASKTVLMCQFSS
jgi:hypothetical protein